VTIEAMKLALEALEESHPEAYRHVITALRTAIEQAEKSNIKQVIHLYDEPPAAPVQEPVAKVVLTETLGLPCLQWLDLNRQFDFKGGEYLYTTSPASPVQEPVKLRRGDVLRCIETDELCTVWATSTTGKTLVKWSANNFGDYTAEQIGELFWIESESEDVEIAAEQSDNYAAFHAGVRFARAHTIAAQPAVQNPATDLVECGNCHEGLSDMDHVCKKCLGAGWIRNSDTTPPAAPVQEPDHGDELTIAYMSGVHRGKELAAQRQWVGLTLEDMETIHWSPDFRAGAKWASAKLKEKNT
jgi:hypothetical protein